MTRKDKIEYLKKILKGQTPIDNGLLGRLTNEELNLIADLHKKPMGTHTDLERACISHYMEEMISRPQTPGEIRGYYRKGDQEEYFTRNIFPGAKETVEEWKERINEGQHA
jgi:hypothetical protein